MYLVLMGYGTEEDIRFLGSGVTDTCEFPYRCWGFNPDPLRHWATSSALLRLCHFNCWHLGLGAAKVPCATHSTEGFLSTCHWRSLRRCCIYKGALGSPTVCLAYKHWEVLRERAAVELWWMVSHDVLQFTSNAQLLYKMMNSSGRWCFSCGGSSVHTAR